MDALQVRIKDPLSVPARTAWLAVVAEGIAQRFIAKYEAGAIEHDGDLGSVDIHELVDHMEQEALDQLAYVREIKRRLSNGK